MNEDSSNTILVRSYLLFLCTIPFGEISIGTGALAWITPTKAGFLVLMAAVVFAFTRGWRPRVRAVVVVPLAALVVGAALAACLSDNPAHALVYAARLAALAILCAVTAGISIQRPTSIGRFSIFLMLFLTGCVLALLGIYQTLTGTTIGQLGVYGDFGRMIDIFVPPGGGVSVVRASSTFDHPNVFGTFMIGVVPIGVLLFARDGQSRLLRMTIGVGVLVSVTAIVYTFSRSAWIGLAAAMLLVAMLRKARMAALFLPTLGVVLAVALLPPEARTVLWNRGGTVQAYDAGRLHSFRTAGRMIRRNPLLGVGPGMFDAAFDEYGGKRKEIRQSRLHTMDAHNTLLDLGAEAGLLTAAPFAALVVCGLIGLWRRRSDPWALMLLAGLSAVSLQSLLNSLEYEEIFWVLIGLSSSGPGIRDSMKKEEAAPARPPAPSGEERPGNLLQASA